MLLSLIQTDSGAAAARNFNFFTACVSSVASVQMPTRCKDHRGFDLISDALPFGRLWYGDANAVANAIGYAEHYSRSHNAVIRVYDDAGNLIETHQHHGDFREF
jgi:hypothetical protein